MATKGRVEMIDGERRANAVPGRPAGWRQIVDQFSRTTESHKPCARCGKVLVLVNGARKHHGLCSDCREG